jgi:Lysyl oxidase
VVRLLFIAGVAATIVGCVRWDVATRSNALLPDLDQVAPYEVSVVRRSGRDLLVFASAVENVGRGPLLLHGERRRVTDPMEVRQIVRGADGSTDAWPLSARMRYVRSQTHSHWHVARFERYELRRPGGPRVGADRKTGFCLGDRYERRRWSSANEPPRPLLVGECRKGDATALRVRQGISPGYGDDYEPILEGQSIDVTDVTPGRYVLVHTADPDGVVHEETRENNAASVLLELVRQRSAFVVTVLRACPETASCP